MSIFDDICSAGFNKEWRMVWARAFIKAWLADPSMQFISRHSLDSMTTLANNWIMKSTDYNQTYPIVSSEDLKEAGWQIIGLEEDSQ